MRYRYTDWGGKRESNLMRLVWRSDARRVGHWADVSVEDQW